MSAAENRSGDPRAAGRHGSRGPTVLTLCGLGLGVTAAVLALASGYGHRSGWWDFRTGFAMLAASGGTGALGALLSIRAAVAAKRRGALRSLAGAVVGLALGTGVAAVPAWNMYVARSVPAIHDITTDTDDPPKFVALAGERAKSPNGADYGGDDVAAAQHAAYPDIKPLELPVPPDPAIDAALAVARQMRFDIADVDPDTGRIEATATTAWFGFKDDIVIRISPSGTGSRVDVRSASRVGKSDIGTNARRIRDFMQNLGARLRRGPRQPSH